MSKAKVLDMTAAQLQRQLEREAKAPVEQQEQQQQHGIFDDMADGIDAIHRCLNLADFTERTRNFVFALADAAKSHHAEHVALFDEELAELQNCSTKTVQRQRADYLKESLARHFAPVEIIEGEFDLRTGKHKPTLYKFHLAEFVEETVTQARASSHWHETDRHAQQEAIRRAAEDVYGMIPDAPMTRRKKKRPRSAQAEIETCQKVILTKLERLKKMAAMLPSGQREELLDAYEPGAIYSFCEQMRAEIEVLQNLNSRQTNDDTQVKGGWWTTCPPSPPADSNEESDADPETGAAAAATWELLEERLTTPAIQSVEIALTSPESPPLQTDELEEELMLEEERAAIMEYDGGLERREAETLAVDEVKNLRSDHVSNKATHDPG